MTKKSLSIQLSASVFLFFLLSDMLLASPKVTQAALVNSTGVRVIEEFGKPPRLDFFVNGKGRIFSVEWSDF